MSEKTIIMNWKKYLLATLAVFLVARTMVAFLFFGVIFNSVYDQPLLGARPEGEELLAPAFIVTFLWSLAFVYIFNKGHENKGLMEGLRFGLIVWSFYFIPMVTCYWAYFDLPFTWLTASLISGLAESLTAGFFVAIIYKVKESKTAQ